MSSWIQSVSDWLWGLPLLTLVLVTGFFVTVRLGGVQFTQFRSALAALREPAKGEGDISPISALATAVSGIVGNGNIAGVATAITAGGPGALFWMWLSGLVGMATMFAESVLGVLYRHRGEDGLFLGGPMYYLRDRLGWPLVAGFFAFGMALKSMLATTTVQSHSIATVVEAEMGIRPLFTCLALSILTAAVVLGGVRSIAGVSRFLAPLMGVIYLGGSLVVVALAWRELPSLFALVVRSAFTPMAAAGGFAGAGVREAIRFGVARGVYSNEAGTGSVPIAHASAKTDNPVRQGKIAMLGVFLDTMVVSTATGLVLLAGHAWTSGLDSTALTAHAFTAALGPSGGYLVLVASILFGATTLFAWAFYGEQCAVYLFGVRARIIYRSLYCLAIIGGAAAGARAIWAWGDLLNGIVAIPSLVAILALSGDVLAAMKRA